MKREKRTVIKTQFSECLNSLVIRQFYDSMELLSHRIASAKKTFYSEKSNVAKKKVEDHVLIDVVSDLTCAIWVSLTSMAFDIAKHQTFLDASKYYVSIFPQHKYV